MNIPSQKFFQWENPRRCIPTGVENLKGSIVSPTITITGGIYRGNDKREPDLGAKHPAGRSDRRRKGKASLPHSLRIIELDPSDLKKLGAWKNTNVRVTSEFGSVVVKAIETTQGPHPGIGFIPMGPWANKIINPNTYSTGMPTFKGTPVKVEVAVDQQVLLGIELVQKACRGETV